MKYTTAEVRKFATELAKKLAEEGFVNIVEGDFFEKKAILETSKYHETVRVDGVLKPIDVFAVANNDLYGYPEKNEGAFNGIRIYAEKQLKNEAKRIGANYLFTRTRAIAGSGRSNENIYGYHITATPYIVISPWEEDQLKQAYQGAGLPKEFRQKAKDCFGLDLYINFVEIYMDSPQEFMKRFVAASEKGKIGMLEEVVKSDKRNDELDMLLSERYPELSKRIARNAVESG